MTSVPYIFILLTACFMLLNNDSSALGEKLNVQNTKNSPLPNSKVAERGNAKFGNPGKLTSDLDEDEDSIKFQSVQTRVSNDPCEKNLVLKPLKLGGENATVLTDLSQYPNSTVNCLFKNKRLPSHIFFKDTVENELVRFEIKDIIPKMSFCATRPQIIFPQAAKSKNDTWKYIVQGEDENSKQGIRIEICNDEGRPCLFESQNIPLGHTTYCVQKYIYRRLMALELSGTPAYDDFKIPSCCECMYATTTNNNFRTKASH